MRYALVLMCLLLSAPVDAGPVKAIGKAVVSIPGVKSVAKGTRAVGKGIAKGVTKVAQAVY